MPFFLQKTERFESKNTKQNWVSINTWMLFPHQIASKATYSTTNKIFRNQRIENVGVHYEGGGKSAIRRIQKVYFLLKGNNFALICRKFAVCFKNKLQQFATHQLKT